MKKSERKKRIPFPSENKVFSRENTLFFLVEKFAFL